MAEWTTGEKIAVGVVSGIALLVIADVMNRKFSSPPSSVDRPAPSPAIPPDFPVDVPPDVPPTITPVAYPVYIVKAADPNGATLKVSPSTAAADLSPKIANETIVSAVGVPSNGFVHVLDPLDLNLVVGWLALKDLQPLITSGIVPIPGVLQT